MNNQNIQPIFFVCNDPERALGLEHIIENYHIICTDKSPIIEIAREQEVKIFSLAEIEKKANPVFRNSNKLLQNKKVQEYIKKNTPEKTKPNIIVFKVSLQIEETCEKLGYNLLNTTSALNKKFELKISQYNNLKSLTTFFPKTIISTLSSVSYNQLKNKLGDKIVIQYNRGHTGNSTTFINNEKEYNKEKNKFRNRLARIAQYIDGDIYTLNACITRYGIAYGGISFQITGVEELTSKQGGTIGNDWDYPKKIEPKAQKQINDMLSRIEKELSAAGFKGMFGVDIVVTPKGKIYLIEINARQPASTPMHTKLMLNEEFIPLQAFHLAEFLFQDNSEYTKFLNKYFNKSLDTTNISRYIEEQNKLAVIPIEASQVFFRNKENIKRKAKENITQGVYIYTQDKLVKTGEGYTIQDIIPGEHLILSTQKEQSISTDHEIARIQTLQGVINERGEIKEEFLNMINYINKKIKLA